MCLETALVAFAQQYLMDRDFTALSPPVFMRKEVMQEVRLRCRSSATRGVRRGEGVRPGRGLARGQAAAGLPHGQAAASLAARWRLLLPLLTAPWPLARVSTGGAAEPV